MRRAFGTLAAVAALFVTAPAAAHFKLDTPVDAIVVDADGDPQKSEPCGSAGAPSSNKITKVGAGTKLVVRWTETVPHPGHFRIAIAEDRDDLVDPEPVVTDNDCKSAPIQSSPVAPVVADGVADHGSSAVGDTYQEEITIPSTPCEKCTLQVTQFMKQHAPSCFYYHCAWIKIVDGYDGPPVVEDLAGGTDPGGEDEEEEESSTDAGKSRKPSSSSASSEPGSGCAAGGDASFGTLAPLAFAGLAFAFSRLRRRSR